MTKVAPVAFLEAALARWRRSGASEDAAALDARAEAALAGWTPPSADSARMFQRAWLRAVDDPIGRSWALTTLLHHIPSSDPIQRACALAKRIDALARHGPDPRFGAAAAVDRAPLPLVTSFPRATPEIAALWQAVQAQPDDDGALVVLADALQGIGDPRGRSE